MTVRERMLAFVQSRELDRVPFVQYSGIGAPDEDVWSLVGRENMGVLRWSTVHSCHSPHCACEQEDVVHDGLRGVRTTLHTPAGPLTEVKVFEPALNTPSIREHFIKEPADYHKLLAHLRDVTVVENVGQFTRDLEELGDYGLPHVSIMRTPYQQMWIQWVSLEDLCLHMVDCPELVNEVTREMARVIRDILEIVRNTPVPYVVFPDNITAPVIGERLFRQYCVPFYSEMADMLSDRDVPVFVHMDGDLRPLWEAIGQSKVGGLDSFSPPPDNDTSALDAVTIWPEMRLGLNFPSSVHLASPEEIRRVADEILEQAGHSGRLQIQISENVPPGVWRKSYPVIVEAINDFGRP